MVLFKNKRKEKKARALHVELERYADIARDNKMFIESRKLSELADLLAQRYRSLDESGLANIERICREMSKSVDKDHAEVLLIRIHRVEEILNGVALHLDASSKALDSNQDTIADLNAKFSAIAKEVDDILDKKSSIESQLKSEEKLMQQAVRDGSEAEYNKHYYKIENLKVALRPLAAKLNSAKNQLNIYAQQIDVFEKQNANIQTSDVIKQTAELAKKIDAEASLVDVEFVRQNAQDNKAIRDRVEEESNKLNDIVEENFASSETEGTNNAHEAFEIARRELLLEEAGNKKSSDPSRKEEDKNL